MTVTVSDIIRLMETIAPPELAEKWDNCGLQVGKRDWTVDKVMISLDPTPPVIEEAVRVGADMLISHHPFLFTPIKTIDLDTPTGVAIDRALRNRLCIFAAHTNLDGVANGLNDLLAAMLNLKNISALQPSVFSSPDFLPQGLGRIGELAEPTNLKAYTLFIKDRLALPYIGMIGDPELQVKRVALCSGSGSGLFSAFYASGAQVYVSGDFRYHDARDAEANQVGLIDIGHFASEHLIVRALSSRLRTECHLKGFMVDIQPCEIEKNPFTIC